MLNETEAMEILAPVLAMAGGQDLDRGALGASITDAYIEAIERYPAAIARQGVRRACASQTSGWRPAPSQVESACKAELEDAAEHFVSRSKQMLPWSEEQKATYSGLSNNAKWDWFIQRYERFYSVNWREMWSKGTYLERARMLPGWEQVEGSSRDVRGEIAATLDKILISNRSKLIGVLDEPGLESA